MKKTNLLITLLICMTASAQSDNFFGIKAGANYSQFRPDIEINGYDVYDFQGKIGYYVGGFFNFGISDKTSVRPELLFANQGTKTSTELYVENIFYGPMEGEIESNWNEMVLLLPISIRYELIERLCLEGGIQAGYAIKRTTIIKKYPFDDPSLEGQKNTHSDFDRFDLGINGGLGFDLTDKLELHCRYSYGVIERENYYKTSVLSLGLGFKI